MFIFLRILFMGSHRFVYQMFCWVGRCKINFSDVNLRKNNMYRNKLFDSCNRGVLVFNCGLCLCASISFSSSVGWSCLLEVILGKNIGFTIIVFDIARWTFSCFCIHIFVTRRTLIRSLVDLRRRKYRFRSGFVKEQLFQEVVLFSDVLDEFCFLFKCGSWIN